jgi:tetratricopeptide (TPR) repeat protein
MDEAIDLLRRARAANPRMWFVHMALAAALGFRGDVEEAKAALAESLKLKPEIDTMAQLRANSPGFASLPYMALIEKTTLVGLRRIDFPEE